MQTLLCSITLILINYQFLTFEILWPERATMTLYLLKFHLYRGAHFCGGISIFGVMYDSWTSYYQCNIVLTLDQTTLESENLSLVKFYVIVCSQSISAQNGCSMFSKVDPRVGIMDTEVHSKTFKKINIKLDAEKKSEATLLLSTLTLYSEVRRK